MCDTACHQCRKCDGPETHECQVCSIEAEIECVCGHWVCPDHTVLCEGCEEAICPVCVVKRDGSNYCGEVDCFPGSEE